jgi:hypothetical protein
MLSGCRLRCSLVPRFPTQVREQDCLLQQASLRLEALALLQMSAKTLRETGSGAAETPCRLHSPTAGLPSSDEQTAPSFQGGPGAESLTAAHRIFLELKRHCASALDAEGETARRAAMCSQGASISEAEHCSKMGSGAGGEEEEGWQEEGHIAAMAGGDLLGDLRLAVADTIADNLALSSTMQTGCMRCSFTTRRRGISLRVQIQDLALAPPRTSSAQDAAANEIGSMSVTSDLFLEDGACERAGGLLAAGHSAPQVVKLVLWPALEARSHSVPFTE